jgi:hypothetical protein
MRTPLEIIAELKHVTYWSQPNIKYDETMKLLNELEATLNPIEEVVVEEPIVEELTVNEELTEEDIEKFNESLASFLEIEVVEESTEEIIEEPTVEVVTPKKRTRKV